MMAKSKAPPSKSKGKPKGKPKLPMESYDMPMHGKKSKSC